MTRSAPSRTGWTCPFSGSSAPAQPAVLDGIEVRIARASATGEGMADSDRPWPGRMRRIVRAKLHAWHRDAWIDSAALLVTELTTNALQHGQADDIGVRLVLTAIHIGIEVDDGTPSPPRLRAADPLNESGRGLPLVAAIADAWGVTPDGTRTWCILNTFPGRH